MDSVQALLAWTFFVLFLRARFSFQVIEPSELFALKCATPHTTHCLADGNIMISCMADGPSNYLPTLSSLSLSLSLSSLVHSHKRTIWPI